MDNNMIRIDDLVRQRLSGGEEPERPGAWLNMRELLDKEMPVAGGYNWRRLIGYLSLLLLLGTATVGGYQWYRNGIGVAGGGSGVADLEKATDAAASGQHTTAQTERAVTGARGANEAIASATSQASAQDVAAVSTDITHTQTRNAVTVAQQATLPTDISSGSKAAAKLPTQHPRNSRQQTASTLALNESTRSGVEHPDMPARTTRNINRHASTSATAPVMTALADAAADKMPPLQPVPGASMGVPAIPQPALARIKHDSVQRLEIISRRVYDASISRYVYRLDTVPLGKFARNIMLPLPVEDQAPDVAAANDTSPHRRLPKRHKNASAAESIAARQAAPVTAAKDALAKADKPMVPNASSGSLSSSEKASDDSKLSETASAAKHFRLFDFSRLAEKIDEVKADLARIEMYPGVMGGINASLFTPNALGGIQAGITSLFILNDWWSLMTELKYYQRFNTGSSVRDDYMQVKDGRITFTQVNGQDYKEYDWKDRTIRHGFNYDVVRTFELPVMLRRNWGQAYAQGGLNFVLSSAISVRETSDSSSDFSSHTELRPATHDDKPFIPNDHPLVLKSDFGARFGVGYVISAGYMFTPNIYVDGRITQSFWDNSKTEGAKQVARDLLRTPSIQISVGYRFGPKN